MFSTRNQVRDHFLSDGNTRWLHGHIQERLTAKLQESDANAPRVRVPLDDFFITEMLQVAESSQLPPQGTLGLAAMNRTFIYRMLNNLWQGVARDMLYNQYELSQNRPRTHPYGQYTAKDGNVTISSSAYAMAHPWAKQRDSYLAATTGLVPTTSPSLTAAQQHARGQMFVETDQYCRTGGAQQAYAIHQ